MTSMGLRRNSPVNANADLRQQLTGNNNAKQDRRKPKAGSISSQEKLLGFVSILSILFTFFLINPIRRCSSPHSNQINDANSNKINADTQASKSGLIDVQHAQLPTLPQCEFQAMDTNELPAQYREEYQLVKDFTVTPNGAMALHNTIPSSDSVCVNNPLMQRLTTRDNNTPMKSLVDPTLIRLTDRGLKTKNSIHLPECASAMTGSVAQLKNDPLWVISMETTTTLSEVNFRKAGFKPELTSAVNGREVLKGCQGSELPAGVVGIRLSFRKLLLRALHEGHERIIIVEDDVVLEDNFSFNLDRNLKTQRCGGFMFDNKAGGVLLLGASEYGGVGLMKGGLKHHKDKCYNVNGLTYGAYASVYHRNVFLPILAWLDAPEFENFPLDHMWKHLALRGFIVRVLKPMAALADIIHSSSTSVLARTPVDKLDTSFLIWRSCLMHWDLQNFEQYRTLLESRQLSDFTRRRYCHRTPKTLYNYNSMHNAVVLLHASPDLASLSSLANTLVERWQAKLDGRYEGFIARPFIVIQAPPGMPTMDTDELTSVVLGMRTQTFDSHQQRVEHALRLAGGNDVVSDESVSSVMRKLISEALAPVLVLDTNQLKELKRILFKQPIAQMYIELHTDTPWVPTDAHMIELLNATKPRGRHWYMLNIDSKKFESDSEMKFDSNLGSDSKFVKKYLRPELILNWSDVQLTANEWLELLRTYSNTVSSISQQILGLAQGSFLSEKDEVKSLEVEVNDHVTTSEFLNNKIQDRAATLVQASRDADDIENRARMSYDLMRLVDKLKKSIHKQGIFLVEVKGSS